MPEKVQMNLNVLPETKDRVKKIGSVTFRDPGDVLDWLVSEAWAKLVTAPEATAVSVETVGDTQ